MLDEGPLRHLPEYNHASAQVGSALKSIPEIQSLLEEQYKVIQLLQDRSFELLTRLSPVLAPPQEEVKREGTPPDAHGYSPLGGIVHSYMKEIRQVSDRLGWILDNLRV